MNTQKTATPKNKNFSNIRSSGYHYFTAREDCPACGTKGSSCRAPKNSLNDSIYTSVFCRGIGDELPRNKEIGDYVFKKTDINGFKIFVHKSVKDKTYQFSDLQFKDVQRNQKFISKEQASKEMKGLSLLLGLNDDGFEFLRSKGLSDFEITALRINGLISSHANGFSVCAPRDDKSLHIRGVKASYADPNNNTRTIQYKKLNGTNGQYEGEDIFRHDIYIPKYTITRDVYGKAGYYKPDTYINFQEIKVGIEPENFNTNAIRSIRIKDTEIKDTLDISDYYSKCLSINGKPFSGRTRVLTPGFDGNYNFQDITQQKLVPLFGYTNIDEIEAPSTYIPQVNVDGRLQSYRVPMVHYYVTDENGGFLASQIRNLWHGKTLDHPENFQDPKIVEHLERNGIHRGSMPIWEAKYSGYKEQWQKSQFFHNTEFNGKYLWCNPQTSNDSISSTEKVDSRTEDFEPPLTCASLFNDFNLRKTWKSISGENFIETPDPFKVILCEGILKPQLTNLRTGITTIGAAGCNFMSSVKQLDRYILKVQKSGIDSNKTVTVQIAPDSGTLNNTNIIKQIVKTIRHLQNKDFVFVEILDWGQLYDNSGNDIDEISMIEFSKAKKIPAKKFLELEAVKNVETQKPEIDNESLELWQKTFRSLEADHEFVSRYVTNTIKVDYQKNDENGALPSNYYQPILDINGKKIETRGKIICIESALGTGKTELLKSIKDVCKYHRMYLCGYRNSLSKQTLERLGNGSYHVHYNNKKEIKNGEILGFCVDSITKVKRPNGYSIMIIDELSSVISHLIKSSTLKDSRRHVIRRFIEDLKSADTIIGLDATIDEMTMKYLTELSSGKDIEFIKNTYSTEKVTKNILLLDTLDSKGFNTNAKQPNVLKTLVEQVSGAKECDVCVPLITDSRKFAHVAESKLTSMGYKVLLVSSTTKDGNEQREFISNPDEFLKHNKYNCLIVTPTIESGIDISIDNYFSSIMGYFTGTIDVKSINQMIGRFRKVYDVMMYANTFNKTDVYQSSLIKTIKCIYNTQEYQAETLNSIGFKIQDKESMKDMVDLTAINIREMLNSEIFNAFNTMYTELLTSTFYEKTNFGTCLDTYLKYKGHNVTHLQDSKPSESDSLEYKEIKERIKISEATDIFKAEIIDDYHTELWANKVLTSFSSNYDDVCIARKVLINTRIPGVIYTESWTVDLVYKELFDKLTSKSIQRFFKLETQNVFSLNELECILEPLEMFESERLKTIGDISLNESMVENLRLAIIKKYGIYDLILKYAKNPNGIKGKDSEMVAIITEMKKDPRVCMLMKKYYIMGNNYTKIFNEIAKDIGVKIDSHLEQELDRTTMEYSRRRYYHYILPGDKRYPDKIINELVHTIKKYVECQFEKKEKKLKALARRASKRSNGMIYVEQSKIYDPEIQGLITVAGFISEDMIMTLHNINGRQNIKI